MFQGSRHHPIGHTGSTLSFENAGEFVQGRACGHDIIHDDDGLPREVERTFKRMTNIVVPCLPGKTGLRGGINPAIAMPDGQMPCACQWTGYFKRLVESACGQSLKRERHGNEHIPRWPCSRQKRLTQQTGNGQAMSVLEGMNQFVYGKRILELSMAGIEMGRVRKACTTDRPIGRAVCTHRATSNRGTRQFLKTGGTEQAGRMSGFAEQAVLRK